MNTFALCCIVSLAAAASGASQVLVGRGAVERDTQEALQHYHLGHDALHSERYDEAEREFRASIKLDPTLELARFGLGQTYMATKRYPDALRAFQACRDVFRANNAADASNALARQQRLDDNIKALEDEKRLYSKPGRNPNTATSIANLQHIDLQLGAMRDARHRYSGGDEPTPAWLSLALGSAYFRTDAFADAEREYRVAIEVNPKLGEAHNNLAVVYLMTNRSSDAASELDAAEKAGFKVNPQLRRDVKNAIAKKP